MYCIKHKLKNKIGGGLRFEASQIGYLPPMASSGVVLLSLALVTLSLPDQPLILCVQLAIITAFTDTSALIIKRQAVIDLSDTCKI